MEAAKAAGASDMTEVYEISDIREMSFGFSSLQDLFP
jgi:hypothetical protein